MNTFVFQALHLQQYPYPISRWFLQSDANASYTTHRLESHVRSHLRGANYTGEPNRSSASQGVSYRCTTKPFGTASWCKYRSRRINCSPRSSRRRKGKRFLTLGARMRASNVCASAASVPSCWHKFVDCSLSRTRKGISPARVPPAPYTAVRCGWLVSRFNMEISLLRSAMTPSRFEKSARGILIAACLPCSWHASTLQ